MKNIYKIILYIFIVFLLVYLTKYLFLLFHKPQYKLYKNVFTQHEIDDITKCFNKNKINNYCYQVKQTNKMIINRIKEHLNLSYLNINHARYSHGNKNYDAQALHRDIKPTFFAPLYTKKWPNVYTIILPFDKLNHQQGNTKMVLGSGDVLLFNAFNLHKGLNMGKFKKHSKRRILQLFGTFLNENDYRKFQKQHSHSEHLNSTFYLKYVNGIFREIAEIFGFAQLFTYKKNTYITNINEKQYINTYDGIKYYLKF